MGWNHQLEKTYTPQPWRPKKLNLEAFFVVRNPSSGSLTNTSHYFRDGLQAPTRKRFSSWVAPLHQVRSGEWKGATGKALTDVVCIGSYRHEFKREGFRSYGKGGNLNEKQKLPWLLCWKKGGWNTTLHFIVGVILIISYCRGPCPHCWSWRNGMAGWLSRFQTRVQMCGFGMPSKQWLVIIHSEWKPDPFAVNFHLLGEWNSSIIAPFQGAKDKAWFQVLIYFQSYLWKWSNLTSVSFRWVAQPPTRRRIPNISKVWP